MKTKLLTLFCCLMSATTLFAYDVTVDGMKYTYVTSMLNNPHSAILVSGSCHAIVNIPSSIPVRNPHEAQCNVCGIGEKAFNGCEALTSICIPNYIGEVSDYAFYNCSNLTSVTINNGTITRGYSGNYGWFDFTETTNLRTRFGSQVKEYILGDEVSEIGNYAFYNCSILTSVTMSENVTKIGSNAFKGCGNKLAVNISNLSAWCKISFESTSFDAHRLYLNEKEIIQLVIPDDVTTINSYAFKGCYRIESIVIGSGVESDGIGSGAFANCPYLMSVTCKAEYPPVISSNVFSGCGVLSGIDLYVPENSVARYKKADVWSEFNIIGKDLSIDDPTNPTNPEDGNYTITWQDEDGNVIKTDQVAQGTTPAFTGTTPTKPATNEYTYEFAGWLPNIKPATEDTKYTTYFIPTQQQESKVYTVNINGENCSLNINNQYPEGTVITLEAVADECFEFRQWSDGNKDNPRTVTVTANTNLTAEFNKVRYTVTGQLSTGGKVQIRKQ